MQSQSHPISSYKSFICEDLVSTDCVMPAVSPVYEPEEASTEMLRFTPYVKKNSLHHTHTHTINIETRTHTHTHTHAHP